MVADLVVQIRQAVARAGYADTAGWLGRRESALRSGNAEAERAPRTELLGVFRGMGGLNDMYLGASGPTVPGARGPPTLGDHAPPTHGCRRGRGVAANPDRNGSPEGGPAPAAPPRERRPGMLLNTDPGAVAGEDAGLERSVRAYLAACAGQVLTPTQWSDIVGLCALLNHVDGVIDYTAGGALVIRHRDPRLDGDGIFRCPPETIAAVLRGDPIAGPRPT